MEDKDGKQINEGDGEGKGDNSNNANGDDDKGSNQNNISPLDEAKAINKETKDLLDRREKVISREEKLHAEKMVGGHTVNASEGKSEPTADEKKKTQASTFFAGTALGDAIDKTK